MAPLCVNKKGAYIRVKQFQLLHSYAVTADHKMYKTTAFLIVTFYIIFCPAYETNVTKYLIQFGFLNESQNEVADIDQALVNFQEYYGLPVDGILNNETEELMNTPRCGVADSPSPFTIHSAKWKKLNLTWYFPLADHAQMVVAAKAFQLWENASNLHFSQSYKNPDILISFGDVDHYSNRRCQGQFNCVSGFDGIGGVLAHAFFPTDMNTCVEIHIDKKEVWYLGIDKTPSDMSSLYFVLAHEIGHTLGLRHSSQVDALMYPYYRGDIPILSSDDVLAIQQIYGPKTTPVSKSITTTTTTSTTPKPPEVTTKVTTTSTKASSAAPPDLCAILPEKLLITFNHHLYIFYKEWVWVLQVGDSKYRKPVLIKDYLYTISPSSLLALNMHIYQMINGDIMLITNDLFYLIEFPALKIKTGYDGISVAQLGMSQGEKINTVFTTYSGKTYIFYNDYYYTELDECTLSARQRGLIKNLFPGIPDDVNRVFKYINGNLYFFRNSTFYEFNEFFNKLIRAGEYDLSLFGINCPQESVFQQIRQLLSRLATFVE